MENRQLCSRWSGVRILGTEQKPTAATQCSSPFWNKISCGIYCAVAFATLCCVYSRFTQGPPRLYKKSRQRCKNKKNRIANGSSNNGCMCSSCLYSRNLANEQKKVQQNQPGASMMEQLVPEITTHILSYLDYPSLCRLSMTNSSMRRAANDNNPWKALYRKDFTTEQDGVSERDGWKSYYAATKAVKDVNEDYYRILRAKNVVDMSHLWLKADYVKCVHPGCQILTGFTGMML